MNKDIKDVKFPKQGNFSASPNNIKNNNFFAQNQKFNLQRYNNNQSNVNPIEEKFIKEGAKKVANAMYGPAAGAAVEALSNTKLGKKAIEEVSQASKNPFTYPFKKKGLFNEKSEDGEGEFSVKNDDILKFGAIGTLGIGGCLSVLIIVVMIAIILSPLLYINQAMRTLSDNLNTFGEELGNFLTFRGWCTDEDCQQEESNDFYQEIQDIYDNYYDKYRVHLNVNLLTATLTYADPFITEDDENFEISFDTIASTEYVNFKKSKRKVAELAKYMVNDGCSAEHCELDIERYRQYLEETFIRKFYFDNKTDATTDINVENAIKDIFLRVETFERMNESIKSDNFVLNNATVTILDCNNGIIIADEIILFDYLQGVLYAEGYATNRSEEFLKAMAVVAKNYIYAINGVKPDSLSVNLRIKSCQMNQIYCSVTEGCHNMEDGTDSNHNTIAPGKNEDGEYYLSPLTDVDTLEKIKSAIDSTFTEFIVKDGKFVTTQYRSQCTNLICNSTTNIMDQLVAYQMINEGSSYTDVLNYFYSGDIVNINLNAIGYPLDLKYNDITSAYGWRVHPTSHCCRNHYGTDISASSDANIYSIADGVIVVNQYNSSYGYYVVVGHGGFNNETNEYEYYSLYAHQIRKSSVEIGQTVKSGEKIGNVGSTGNSTGPHLHIEIYTIKNGIKKRQDPVEYFKNVQLKGFVSGAIYADVKDCMEESGKGSC